LIIHEKVYDQFKEALLKIYPTIKIGNPLDNNNIMGPLHTKSAVKEFEEGINEIVK